MDNPPPRSIRLHRPYRGPDLELKRHYTIVIVTQNMQQAARVSDITAFFFQGALVEAGPTDLLYTRPPEEDGRLHHGRFG